MAQKENGGNQFVRKMPLTKEQEREIFIAAETKTMKEIGLEFGFDKYYDTDIRLISAVHYIVKKVRKHPVYYEIDPGTLDIVTGSLANRAISEESKDTSIVGTEQDTFRDRLDCIRNKTAEIINKKLDTILKTKAGIDGASFKDLKDLLSTAIDKSRLLRGESTETVMNISKINTDNMTAEDALKLVFKAREALIEAKK